MEKGRLKRQSQSAVFFIGWALSPFTTWNDSFVNLPLSYLVANFLYLFVRADFGWLLMGSYIFTNVLGLAFMFFSGKEYVLSTRNKLRAVIFLIVNTALLSAVIYFLDKKWILQPLTACFLKFYHH